MLVGVFPLCSPMPVWFVSLSSIMYASSYCVTNRRHSNKRSCPDSGASGDEIFDFSRWFVVQPADENISLNSLSPPLLKARRSKRK